MPPPPAADGVLDGVEQFTFEAVVLLQIEIFSFLK